MPEAYDDGGFSGGSLDRPALQQLLAEVRAGRVDVIVVYKVDRLTSSLSDFAKLVELFDQHGVSFVSVIQAFKTTTSMGRLTLNVLLSFAQSERGVTGERIRDKIAASKKKGLRVGGPVPLGYAVQDEKLVPRPTEAAQVRLIFTRYLELDSRSATRPDRADHGASGLHRDHAPRRSGRGGTRVDRGSLGAAAHAPPAPDHRDTGITTCTADRAETRARLIEGIAKCSPPGRRTCLRQGEGHLRNRQAAGVQRAIHSHDAQPGFPRARDRSGCCRWHPCRRGQDVEAHANAARIAGSEPRMRGRLS